MILLTTTILGNEKAVGLLEMNEVPPMGGASHRYQKIRVIRDDRIAEFRRDMGLAKNYKGVRQLNIPSYMEHTVDELMGLADELRIEPVLDVDDFLQMDKGKYKLA